MSIHLNLRQPSEVAAFFDSVMDFLPERDRAPYLALLAELQAGRHVDMTRLVEAAKNLGAATWPARRALKHFLDTVGASLEWDELIGLTEPSLTRDINKLQRAMPNKSLDQALASADAGLLINLKEDAELDIIRDQVRRKIWKEHQDKLEPMVQEAWPELEALRKRLKTLREEAMAAPPIIQDALLSKLDHFEDKIYFGGEHVPLEILDQEITYDVGDREIVPNEEPMG